MNYDITKFERGQVWMIRFKNPQEQVGHEQKKDRPWLILSLGKFNKSSGMVTAVPITTRDNICTPSQVKFINDRNQNNVIMCENIRTFDCNSGAYIFDFMGNISSEILEKVDVALSIHLGLHYSPITLQSLYDSMEAIIKSVGHMQQKASTPVFTDNDVLQFAEKLQMLAGTAANEVSATIQAESGTFREVLKPVLVVKEEESIESLSTTKSEKAPRIKWTPETCEEFIRDCDNLPMKKVMEKWNMQKKTRFYSTKNYVQNLLMKMTES